MRKLIMFAAAVVFAAAGVGCSRGGVSPDFAKQAASAARTSYRRVQNQPVPIEELAPRPTFSIRPVEVATPVPVFADSAEESPGIIYEPVVPDEEDMRTASPEEGAPQPFSGRTIAIRFYNLETRTPAEIEYPISDDASPNMVLAAVGDALSELLAAQNVRINATSYTDGDLYVDFDPGIYELGLESTDENLLLQSIADTYLINLDGIRAVYYTVGGKPYHSENVQMEGNEAFKELLG